LFVPVVLMRCLLAKTISQQRKVAKSASAKAGRTNCPADDAHATSLLDEYSDMIGGHEAEDDPRLKAYMKRAKNDRTLMDAAERNRKFRGDLHSSRGRNMKQKHKPLTSRQRIALVKKVHSKLISQTYGMKGDPITSLFKKFDKNRDGKLSMEEFSVAIRHLCKVTPFEAETLGNMIDRDHNEELCPKEFALLIHLYHKK